MRTELGQWCLDQMPIVMQDSERFWDAAVTLEQCVMAQQLHARRQVSHCDVCPMQRQRLQLRHPARTRYTLGKLCAYQ